MLINDHKGNPDLVKGHLANPMDRTASQHEWPRHRCHCITVGNFSQHVPLDVLAVLPTSSGSFELFTETTHRWKPLPFQLLQGEAQA